MSGSSHSADNRDKSEYHAAYSSSTQLNNNNTTTTAAHTTHNTNHTTTTDADAHDAHGDVDEVWIYTVSQKKRANFETV